jgi:hypothetical protein
MAVAFANQAESGLVDAFFDSVLGFAHGLLSFAFLFLHNAFGAHLVVAGSLANALLDVTSGFIGHAFNFIACAAHGISPEHIDE